MAKATSWSSERWLPVKGRAPVCRSDGCSEPATDEVRQQCEDCGRWQPTRLRHNDRALDRAAQQADLMDLLTRPDWAAKAACREHPEADMFPETDPRTAAGLAQVTAAKAICSGGCPVRAWRTSSGSGAA